MLEVINYLNKYIYILPSPILKCRWNNKCGRQIYVMDKQIFHSYIFDSDCIETLLFFSVIKIASLKIRNLIK